MWGTEYIKAVKLGLRDQYGFEPEREDDGDIAFAEGAVPDGEYPMIIEGKLDKVRITNGRIWCCNFD